jgi:hypothetical protein
MWLYFVYLGDLLYRLTLLPQELWNFLNAGEIMGTKTLSPKGIRYNFFFNLYYKQHKWLSDNCKLLFK